MDIIDMRECYSSTLSDLDPGDIFEQNGCFFILTDARLDEDNDYTVIKLEDGAIYPMNKDLEVTLVKATLTIQDEG